MTLEDIKEIAQTLAERRTYVASCERLLQQAVQEYLEQSGHGSAREMARQMGISVQYLCDVRYGRRKISPAFLKSLELLSEGKAAK